MAKAEFGSAKYISNQMKARGLQKLRFYCQVCQKQCRDENGFKSHIRSPSHLKNISEISEADIDEYSRLFEEDFLKLLRLSHGEKKIEANKFYNQFIQAKDHIHMNATRFTSLSKFIHHLNTKRKIAVHGSEGNLEDMDPAQLLISYIDNSKENVLRKVALNEIETSEISDQDIRAKLLQRQIEKSLLQTESKEKDEVVEEDSISANFHPDKVMIDLKTSMNGGKVSKKKKSKPKKMNVFK